MSSVFIIDNTDGTLSLTMTPGSLDGPGSGTRNSDMRIYGMGSLLWGEGVNENMLRLAENFACPEKGTPNEGTPQDEGDLGPGKGIVVPLEGQTWFNKTDKKLYVYNGTAWNRTSGIPAQPDPPAYAVVGDLWYDTLVAITSCNEPVLKMYDPSHPQELGDGWFIVGSDRVQRCGDTMSGVLDMGSNRILNLVTSATPGGTDAVNVNYLNLTVGTLESDLLAHTGNGDLHLNSDDLALLYGTVRTGGCGNSDPSGFAADLCRMNGFVAGAVSSANPNVPSGVNVWDLVEGDGPGSNEGKLDRAGDTMFTNSTLTVGRDPVASMEVVTKNYFDNNSSQLSAGGVRFVTFFNTTIGGSPQDGDVAVPVSGQAYIRIGGAWIQIYPAQYAP